MGIMHLRIKGSLKESQDYLNRVECALGIDYYMARTKLSDVGRDLFVVLSNERTRVAASLTTLRSIYQEDLSNLLKVSLPEELPGPEGVTNTVTIDVLAKIAARRQEEVVRTLNQEHENPAYYLAYLVPPNFMPYVVGLLEPKTKRKLIWTPSDRGYELLLKGKIPMEVYIAGTAKRLSRKAAEADEDLEGIEIKEEPRPSGKE